jgi:outer membrane protein TolC
MKATGAWNGVAKATAWGSLLLLAGCVLIAFSASLSAAPVPAGAQVQPGFLPSLEPKQLARGILQPAMADPPNGPRDQGKALPISLDTVFRLAEDQNGKIAIAREQLNEAFAAKDLADKSWVPDLFVGTTYFRHEGGIPDFQGFLIHSSYGSFLVGPTIQGTFDLRDFAYRKIDAERKIWQQRGEISKLTAENLLDAASTYIDLLAARTGEALSLKHEEEIQKLLEKTQKLAKVEPGFQIEVFRIQGQLDGQKQITRKMREGSRSAAAKLIYLLGLDPDAELVPVDSKLKTFTLVDDSVPAGRLVERALSQGPGIREMTGLLSLIDDAAAKSKGLAQFIPVVQIGVAEGALGTGPGDSMKWDNSLNAAVTVGWRLGQFFTAPERRRLADSKMMQAQLGFQELRGKLTFGVREALEASHSGNEQKKLGVSQVDQSLEAYRKSVKRFDLFKLRKFNPVPPSEVLMSLGTLAGAEANLIHAVRDHDKAQLRLFVLTGQVDRYATKE